MNKKTARTIFSALVLAAVFHGIAFGETPRGAGIVTTLQGEAIVTRTSGAQQPVRMKFRDEVYFKDQISVKEHSLARVLLGGKALVTVRELSDLTINESPNKPTVLDMLSGKISLAVAKLRMQPGEAIEVRTPNAVAAVRGTTVIVEVVPTSGSNASGKPADMVTDIHVLSGKVDVFSPGSPTKVISVGPGFSVSVTGAVLGQLRPNPPSAQLVQGLRSSSQHNLPPEEVKKDFGAKEMAKALAIAESIAPKNSGQGGVERSGKEGAPGQVIADKGPGKGPGSGGLGNGGGFGSGGIFGSGGGLGNGGGFGNGGGVGGGLGLGGGGLIGDGDKGKKSKGGSGGGGGGGGGGE